jgi:hypothetical protein
MTLKEFPLAHHLPPEWVELREQCERIVMRDSFWYRHDLQEGARHLATHASDILADSTPQVHPKVFRCAG